MHHLVSYRINIQCRSFRRTHLFESNPSYISVINQYTNISIESDQHLTASLSLDGFVCVSDNITDTVPIT